MFVVLSGCFLIILLRSFGCTLRLHIHQSSLGVAQRASANRFGELQERTLNMLMHERSGKTAVGFAGLVRGKLSENPVLPQPLAAPRRMNQCDEHWAMPA